MNGSDFKPGDTSFAIRTARAAKGGDAVEVVQIDPMAQTVWERLSADLRNRLQAEIISGSVKTLGPDIYSAKADGVMAIFRHPHGHPEGTVVSVLTPSEQAILW